MTLPGQANSIAMKKALGHAERLGRELIKQGTGTKAAVSPISIRRTAAPDRSDVEAMRSGRMLAPQPGPQEVFLSTKADIAIYGGAAGGGKSYALLMEAIRHIANPRFTSVIFRRTYPQITNEGGLWDTSVDIYQNLGLIPKPGILEWRAHRGGTVRFAHMQHEQTKLEWQGSQIPLICFDELTHFTAGMFWYMLSRNRSTSGVKPYIRATTNPDANSFVADLIEWWLDEKTGYPLPERSGVVRWFVRVKGEIHWGASRQELLDKFGGKTEDGSPLIPKSFTFVASTIEDNKVLMLADPDYRGNLEALTPVERERLLKGNWKIRESAGTVLDRGWFEVVDEAPMDLVLIVRAWDTAATSGDGDYTVGVKLGKRSDGSYIVLSVVRGQWGSGERKQTQKNTALADTRRVTIGIEQEPGSAGVDAVKDTVAMFDGWNIEVVKPTGDKVTRALPFAAQAQSGRVKLLRAPWNEAYLAELHAFPTKGIPDDQVDATTLAYSIAVNYQTWSTSRLGIV